jgi:hypothetical protein
MKTRRRYSLWMDENLAAAMKAVKEQDGVPESVQIRKALAEWLQRRGALKKGGPKKPKA